MVTKTVWLAKIFVSLKKEMHRFSLGLFSLAKVTRVQSLVDV